MAQFDIEEILHEAHAYGLRLNRAKELKFARLILGNLYCRDLC